MGKDARREQIVADGNAERDGIGMRDAGHRKHAATGADDAEILEVHQASGWQRRGHELISRPVLRVGECIEPQRIEGAHAGRRRGGEEGGSGLEVGEEKADMSHVFERAARRLDALVHQVDRAAALLREAARRAAADACDVNEIADAGAHRHRVVGDEDLADHRC
jgi:hypothetical protein